MTNTCCGRVYGHDHDDPTGPAAAPDAHRSGRLSLDGLLLDITGRRPEEIADGVALMTELGRWPGGR
ncbi:hypothetical protein OCG20_24995 [Streptomyces sp. G-5]|nr:MULTISPECIES: hypothetical protein [unclassified Streptomyces]MCU4749685.1 hypothetical protein [Streptomyces sp. G-5]